MVFFAQHVYRRCRFLKVLGLKGDKHKI